jgi:uncharacterized protein (DUF1778 family)
MTTTQSTARLEARIPQDLKPLLRRAADLEGLTVTDYIIQVLRQASEATLHRTSVIHLALVDQEAFASAILAPPPVAPALARAFERRRELLGTAD